MLSDERLLLSLNDLARAGQRGPVLLLVSQIAQPSSISKIKDKARNVGFRSIEKWNVAQILLAAAKDGQVAHLVEGWKLLEPGFIAIHSYYKREAALIGEIRHSLKSHLAQIPDEQRRAFVEESVSSFDVKAYRAAVVLSWVGAVHILQEHVVARHLTDFNAAGLARALKAGSPSTKQFSPVRSIKDFGIMTEAEFLQLCQDSGVLHKAEKQILGERLDLRNQCGHPNPIKIAEHVVASHIEILMLNVYSKY